MRIRKGLFRGDEVKWQGHWIIIRRDKKTENGMWYFATKANVEIPAQIYLIHVPYVIEKQEKDS